MKAAHLLIALTLPLAGYCAPEFDRQQIERGRYLVKTTGCNDCHTPRYAQRGDNVAEKDWLIGDTMGWHGPWGTTYPTGR